MAPAAKKAAAKAKADASQTSKQGFSSLFGRKPGAADGAPAAPPPEAAAAAPAMAAQPAPPCAPVPPSGAGPAAAAAAGAAAAAAGVPAPAATAGVSQLTEEQKSRIEENRRRAEERRAAKKRALEPGAPEAPPPQQSPPPQAPSPEAKAKAKAKAKTKAKAKAKAKAEGSEPVGADAAASPPKSDASPHLAVETPEKTPPGGKAVRPAAPPAHAAAGGGGKFAAIGGAWGQFNDVYRWRLQHLRGPVLQEARKLWGGMLPPQSFAPDIGGYKRGVEGQEAVIVGVAFKDLKSRTDVIKMYQDAIGFGHISDKETLHLGQSICSDEDSVWLEDSAMRVQLALPPEEAGRIATGVVLAARGAATPEGLFRPTALCCASVPAPPPLPAMAADPAPGPFLALVSGLGFGDKEAESTGLAAARERLRGLFASEDGQAPPGAVQKLIVCGGLVRADFREKGSVVAAMAEADAAFAKIAAIVPTEVMPGYGDPSNLSLPQMPLHPHLFRQSRQLGSAAFRSVSNPLECELDGVRFLGHSGQPVMDLLRGTRLGAPMSALQLSLEALHLAPTAPDSIPSQPFVDGDPFVIDKIPHVLFSGGHDKAEHLFRGHPSGDSGTTCICVPAFNRQPAVVFVNLRDPRDVRVHELGDVTMQDAC